MRRDTKAIRAKAREASDDVRALCARVDQLTELVQEARVLLSRRTGLLPEALSSKMDAALQGDW